jgi:hypothetical protein
MGMDIVTGIAAAGQALDVVKKLRDLEKNFDAATFRMEIANLQLALSDAQIALSQAQLTIAERDAEIRRLKEVQAGKMPVVQYRGYNFGIDSSGRPIGLPFCRTCEQRTGEQNQLSKMGHDTIFCSVCHSVPSDAPTALPQTMWPQGT